jgi:hypothetical protein
MKKLLACTSALCFCASFSFAAQNIIADWTFENSFPSIGSTGNQINGISADIGLGTASGFHASSSTAWSSPTGNGSDHSLSSSFWGAGDYYQFQTSTLGYSSVTLSFNQTGNSTGPKNFILSYSLDGNSFTTVGSPYSVLLNGGAPNPAWNSGAGSGAYIFNYDLSAVSSLDNAQNVYFRLSAADAAAIGGGSVDGSGSSLLDNFVVAATPVPEPSMLALIGVGLAGLMIVRKNAK